MTGTFQHSGCRKAAFTPCRDGCGDEGRSAAENFNGALVAPINAAEPVARVPGASQSYGLRVCPLAGSLARGG